MMKDATIEHQRHAVDCLCGGRLNGPADQLDDKAAMLLETVATRGAKAERIRDHAIMLGIQHPAQKGGMIIRDKTSIMHCPCKALRLVTQVRLVHHGKPL